MPGFPELGDIIDAAFDNYHRLRGIVGPSWIERALADQRAAHEAYVRGGVREMMRDTSATQDLAGGFAASTSGKINNLLVQGAQKLGGVSPAEIMLGGLKKLYEPASSVKATMEAQASALPSAHPRSPQDVSDILAVAPSAQSAPLDINALKKTGEALGTNPGGTYMHPESGQKYYIKQGLTSDHVRNEMMAADLYKLAGTPTFDYVPIKGDMHVATKWEPLVKNNANDLNPQERVEAQRDLAAHAWLANWDAAGVGPENPGGNIGIRAKDYRVLPLDLGGALKYSGLGGEKGDKFGNTVSEISLLRTKKNENGKLFGDMSDAQLADSMRRVTEIGDEDIRNVVQKHRGSVFLADKLIARRDDIGKQLEGIARPSGGMPSGGPGIAAQPYMPDKMDKLFESYQNWKKLHGLPGELTMDEMKEHLVQNHPGDVGLHSNINNFINNYDQIANEALAPKPAPPAPLGNEYKGYSMLSTPNENGEFYAYDPGGHNIGKISPSPYSGSFISELKDDPSGQFDVGHASPQHALKYMAENHPSLLADESARYAKHLEPLDWNALRSPEGASVNLPEHALEQGYNALYPLFKGVSGEKGEGYPLTMGKSILEGGSKKWERGLFFGDERDVARAYAGMHNDPLTYVARAKNPLTVDWKKATGMDSYDTTPMHHLIEAARKQGADLLHIRNISDIGDNPERGVQSQVVALDPSVVRAPGAAFDPTKAYMNAPLAGLAAAGATPLFFDKNGNFILHIDRGVGERRETEDGNGT